MPYLVVREPGRVARSFELSRDQRVGRDPDCELIVSDRQVSRRHAAFVREEGSGWSVSDLGSRHGTIVNGLPLPPAQPHRLRDGDRVQIGGSLLVFCEQAERPAILHTRTTDAAPPAESTPEQRRLRLFHEVGRAVAGLEDPDTLLERMLEATAVSLGFDLGVIGLAGPGGALRRITWRRPGVDLEDPVLAEELLHALLVERQAVALDRAMAAPLRTPRRSIGLIHLSSAARGPAAEDLEVLVAIANLTASAVEGAELVRRAEGIAEAWRDEGRLAGERAGEIVGESEPMRRLRSDLARFAAADAPVHLRGESGTGKELAARAIHAASPRTGEPFVVVNCAALPEALIESELFGHVKGAFTGALRDRRGRFSLAHRGTLFLDEIAELSPSAQAKLLRVLEDGEVQPVGGERPLHVDVRILSATNRDLGKEVVAGRFRDDLYWRLAVLEVELPPLRARGDDVLLLAERFLAREARRRGRRLIGFTPEARAALAAHAWPGNVRELANEAARVSIVAAGPLVDERDLSDRVRRAGPEGAATPAATSAATRSLAQRFADLDLSERDLVQEGMRAARGNVSEAARLLGISRIMMRRRLERFEIEPEEIE